MDLLKRTTQPVANIIECLFRDTPAKLHAGITPANKQQVLKQAADRLRSDVLTLEEIAPEAKSHVETFKESYRAVFKLPVETQDDRDSMESLLKTYSINAATTWRQYANLVEERSGNIKRFKGNEQNLNRVVTRATAALDDIVETTRDLASFCAVEMANTIKRRLLATQEPPKPPSQTPVQ